MTAKTVPFDPTRADFGKVRAAVKVTLNGYTFRRTIASETRARRIANLLRATRQRAVEGR